MNDISNPADLTSFLAKLTPEPGVYRMLDAEGTVLYVGKAINLKKRVSSYFNKQANAPKTRSLVSQISSIDVTITRSETEALLLESTFIKTLLPKYNILLRDDKSYPYLHLSLNHPFPRLDFVRLKKRPQKEGYYGPYPSIVSVRETLNTIQKVFKIRNCSDAFFSSRSRPCLQYQIKRCTAPCTAYISKAEYQQSVSDAQRFLQGKCQLILDELGKRMQAAVTRLDYEQAAVLRDQIKSLRLVQEQQAMVQKGGDVDIIAIEAQPGFACIQLVCVRDGQVLSSNSYFPAIPLQSFDDSEAQSLWQDVFEAFIRFHYIEKPESIPETIIIHEKITSLAALEAMLAQLSGKKCQIKVSPRGLKARWLDFALNNLQRSVTEHQLAASTIRKRYQALAELLHREAPINRMECFDISHTQGEATVASCVVFDADGPVKNQYRRFNIEGITGGDDYAAMEQAIGRRFKRLLAEQRLPDLLIVDGGKGQVGVARRVLEELGISEVLLLGIAKGPDRKAGWERLIMVAENKEITLPADSPALHLLQHIRDEAHRFAITGHRNKRQKARTDSSLESIEGVGPKRRQALLHRFGGIRELARASIEEIARVNGINSELAERIYQFFR